jgi:hypothetical protein
MRNTIKLTNPIVDYMTILIAHIVFNVQFQTIFLVMRKYILKIISVELVNK